MNPSRLFILRPIATSLLMIALLLVGTIAYQVLPISSLPEVDYPTVRILTYYPGASPEVVASVITAPLEKQLGLRAGLNLMTSNSSSGTSVITLQFSLALPLDVAEQEVQAAINAASNFLPKDLPYPPIYSKVNPADPPILTLGLTSQTIPLTEVEDYADNYLVQKISQLTGVGLVSIAGGQRPAIRIQVNTSALAAYGLNLENIRTVIVNANVNAAKGSFDGPRLAYTINANDQIFTKKAYQDLIIAYKNNSPIYLSDVATVTQNVENAYQAAWINQTPAIIVNIQRQPGANVIEVVDRIKNLLSHYENILPKNIHVTVLADRTTTIRASIKAVQSELMIAVALVVLVIFLFLRNIPITIIPSVAIPISIAGTFGVMYLAGFSLNNLTLMGLTIATGFIIDDAIVMIENISRYIELGHSPLDAAMKGSAQIAFTILSLTVSLIAVLIPLLFMQDIIGKLFHEFAITVAVAILFSAIVSLTLTPMMCSKILQPHHHTKIKEESTKSWDQIIHWYRTSLTWTFHHQKFILYLTIIMLSTTFILLYFVDKGFFPMQDTGLIQGITEASQSISFQAMAKKQLALASIVAQDPAVENLSSFIGIDGTNLTLNNGRMLVSLLPLNKRNSTSEVIQRIQARVASVPGINLYFQPLQDLTINDRISRTQYQYSLNAPDEIAVNKWANLLLKKLQHSSILQDVTYDQQNFGLETFIQIDRNTASRLGITPLFIDNILYDAFGQRQISTLFTQQNQYRVVLEAQPNVQQSLLQLNNVYATSKDFKAIPLSTFTTIFQRTIPLIITRQGQFPVAIISFNLAPGASLGDAIHVIQQAKNDLKIPTSIQTGFEGTAKSFQNSLANEGWLILAAILVVYIVLGVLYESYIHPITILSTLPSACMGALLALFITKNELSIIALIGIILLIGIVMKNAIMMIDFALEQERVYKKPPLEAIFQAAMLRFRPILMTTMASILGAVPLAFSADAGSELRQPLGLVIISGLLVSQLVTLYTTPVIYLFFDRNAQRFKTWRQQIFKIKSSEEIE